jgi:two-component system chemotaxis response regulator CheY
MALDVLIVDDCEAIRKILTRALAHASLPIGEIFEAVDGIEALKMLESKKVDLILADINMPNMGGLQLLASVRARPEWKAIPLIIMTTDGSQAKVQEALQLGAQAYFLKPFAAEEIKKKISAYLHEIHN